MLDIRARTREKALFLLRSIQPRGGLPFRARSGQRNNVGRHSAQCSRPRFCRCPHRRRIGVGLRRDVRRRRRDRRIRGRMRDRGEILGSSRSGKPLRVTRDASGAGRQTSAARGGIAINGVGRRRSAPSTHRAIPAYGAAPRRPPIVLAPPPSPDSGCRLIDSRRMGRSVKFPLPAYALVENPRRSARLCVGRPRRLPRWSLSSERGTLADAAGNGGASPIHVSARRESPSWQAARPCAAGCRTRS